MLYQYRALKDSIQVKKRIEASSEKAVVDYLKKNGYFPTAIFLFPYLLLKKKFLLSLF